MNSELKFLVEYYIHSKICSGISYFYNNNYLIANDYDLFILFFITPYNKESIIKLLTTNIQH